MIKYSEDICTGTKSIQREINNLAKASGKDTAKKLQSKEWREGVRQKLQKAHPHEWCDYKAQECVCELD